MIALLCGSRGWHDPGPIEEVLDTLQGVAREAGEDLTIVHGAAPGLDRLAAKLARRRGLKVCDEPAEWDRYGRAAGPIRNQKMLDDYKPDVIWAFRATGKSRGTADMIQRGLEAGVPTHTVWGGES